MKLNAFAIGALVAVGCSIGFSAQALTRLEACCQTKYEECLLGTPPGGCGEVYAICVASRRCILD